MKNSEEKARLVISMFENFLCQEINIEEYRTEEFFHVFIISPILIAGKQKSMIRFKDSLIDDCIAMQGSLPDIEEFVQNCFFDAN